MLTLDLEKTQKNLENNIWLNKTTVTDVLPKKDSLIILRTKRRKKADGVPFNGKLQVADCSKFLLVVVKSSSFQPALQNNYL